MKEKLITKSFERLLDKGLHRGFITYEELGKSLGKRNSSIENVEKATLIIFEKKVSLVQKKSDFQKPKKKDSKRLKSTQLLLNRDRSKNLSQNPLLFDSCERFNLSFNLNIRSSKLSKDNYYNPYQYKLFRLIKFLKEERGIGYRRISHILYDKGFRSVRTNSILKYNYVYSIYYKGKIRESRINRNFESEITDVKMKF